MNFPKIYRVRQKFDRTLVQDIPGTVKAELKRLSLEGGLNPVSAWPSPAGAAAWPTSP